MPAGPKRAESIRGTVVLKAAWTRFFLAFLAALLLTTGVHSAPPAPESAPPESAGFSPQRLARIDEPSRKA